MKNTNFGMSYNHVSNASLGDKNPGANSYMFNFSKSFKLIYKILMNLKDCYNFDDFRKLAKKNYQLQYFIT